ncbi:hypothetical protein TruAng_011516 [Truncatella angustata]|nr:hypothetical protein TruAng_011516 [Truncatella angustata]
MISAASSSTWVSPQSPDRRSEDGCSPSASLVTDFDANALELLPLQSPDCGVAEGTSDNTHPAVVDGLQTDTGDDSARLIHGKGQANDVKDRGNLESPRHRSSIVAVLLTLWWAEVGACILMLIALVAGVFTLSRHEGKPLPAWPLKITINALLSIFALILRAAVMFILASGFRQLQWSWFRSPHSLYDMVRYEDAGRGMWGSLGILWNQKFRQPLTAIGAIIATLSIAIDPAFQQLAQLRDCYTVLRSENATLPRTNNFVFTASEDQLRFVLNEAAFGRLDELTGSCSTGNCTFSTVYSSAAYCSSCTDISEDITFEDKCFFGLNHSETEIPAEGCSSTFSLYRWILPSGLTATSNIFMGNVKPQPGDAKFITVSSNTTTSLDNDLGFTRMQLLLGGSNFPKGYGAAQCTLEPCVRTYNATIEAGRVFERELLRSPPNAWSWPVNDSAKGWKKTYYENVLPGPAVFDRDCVSKKERALLQEISPSPERWLSSWYEPEDSQYYKNPQLYDNIPVDDLIRRHCFYLIDRSFAQNNLSDLIKENFEYYSADYWEPTASINSSDPIRSPLALRTLYNEGAVDFDRIQDFFANVSDAITFFIRRQDSTENPTGPATGDVLHYAACLSVQWLWVILPSAISGATLLFLCLVMVKSGAEEAPLWKNSSLAWILRGPFSSHVNDLDAARNSEKTSTWMEKTAKETQVVLVTEPQAQIRLRKI